MVDGASSRPREGHSNCRPGGHIGVISFHSLKTDLSTSSANAALGEVNLVTKNQLSPPRRRVQNPPQGACLKVVERRESSVKYTNQYTRKTVPLTQRESSIPLPLTLVFVALLIPVMQASKSTIGR